MSGGRKMTITVRLYAGLPEKVRARLAGGLPAPSGAGVPLTRELADGTAISSLLAELHLETIEVLTMFVNGRARGPEHVLSDGDQIGLFPPIGGG